VGVYSFFCHLRSVHFVLQKRNDGVSYRCVRGKPPSPFLRALGFALCHSSLKLRG
jgi:hypothetical protein